VVFRLRRMQALSVGTYDGDTPLDERGTLRAKLTIVFTNIDMLHSAILPNHRSWPRPFWSNLKAVVLDEAHYYSGVFGSHTALVLRRLRRICESYSSKPLFLCCSATIANPAAHVERLTGRPPRCISESGAPSGRKAIMLWQPPETSESAQRRAAAAGDEEAPKRRSAFQEAGEVVAELVAAGLTPLVFVPARKLAEIVASAARATLKTRGLHSAAERIESYRAGYSSAERRDLERRLSDGSLSCLVSTSALELGIDVGELDATVHVGVPDTASAQWQQAGRSGRSGGGDSLALIIATERPLDLLFLSRPEELAARRAEAAHIDATNQALMILHLAAAAAEMKLVAGDGALFGGAAAYAAAIKLCVNANALFYEPGLRCYATALESPAQGIALRGGLSRDGWALHDGRKLAPGDMPVEASLVELVDVKHVRYKLFVGAIFHHRERTYEVVRMEEERKLAIGRDIGDSPYLTTVRDNVMVREVREFTNAPAGATRAWLGRVHVSTTCVHWQKENIVSGKIMSEDDFKDPPLALDLETDGVWWEVPPEVVARLTPGGELASALAGVKNLVLSLLPSIVACASSDIGGAFRFQNGEGAEGGGDASVRIYVFDMFGGVGLCHLAFASLTPLWRQCITVLERCPCELGCASCTHAGRSGKSAKSAKKETRVVLDGLTGAWMADAAAPGSLPQSEGGAGAEGALTNAGGPA